MIIRHTLTAFLLLGLSSAVLPSHAETEQDISCRDPENLPDNWLDQSHAYLNDVLCEPAAWFDGFFGDPRSEETTPVGTFFRWRNQVRWDEREGTDFRSRLYGNVRLPHASRKLRLLISRDSDPAGADPEDDRVSPGQQDRTEIGLRYIVRSKARSEFNVDAGVRGGLPPKFFARARYIFTRPLTDSSLARLTETAFWRSDDDGFGLDNRLDWEWLFDPLTLVRWTGAATISQDTDGVDWETRLTGFHQLSDHSAIRLETGVNGYTSPSEVDEYYVNFRYRSTFLRPWLYYELQPEIAWPLYDDGNRELTTRFIFTLEIQFENWPTPTR